MPTLVSVVTQALASVRLSGSVISSLAVNATTYSGDRTKPATATSAATLHRYGATTHTIIKSTLASNRSHNSRDPRRRIGRRPHHSPPTTAVTPAAASTMPVIDSL